MIIIINNIMTMVIIIKLIIIMLVIGTSGHINLVAMIVIINNSMTMVIVLVIVKNCQERHDHFHHLSHHKTNIIIMMVIGTSGHMDGGERREL